MYKFAIDYKDTNHTTMDDLKVGDTFQSGSGATLVIVSFGKNNFGDVVSYRFLDSDVIIRQSLESFKKEKLNNHI